jgi:glycosyltransferase involved in cell wall biosynthesis
VRLMVVGHPFLLAYNQRKYLAMKRLDETLQLHLVVPSRGCDRFFTVDYQVHPELCRDEVVPLRSCFAENHMSYMHSPPTLAAILRGFQPDVIHIEEEPHALITLETIALRDMFAPQAALSLFTWDNIVRPRRFPLGIAKRRFRAYSLRRTSLMICGNREAAEILRKEGLFEGVIEVLPQYGIDAIEHAPGTEIELRHELGLDAVPVIGYVGQMVEKKGLRLLLEALQNLLHERWKLMLVGSGPLEPEIREEWMVRLPGRVVLVPAVRYEEVPRYFRCIDIFVLCSLTTPTWKEQFGLSLAQAMMSGISCIGSNSGAIPDTLGPGGAIFEQRDTDGLRLALEDFLKSPTRRYNAAQAGRKHALENYTVERIAARYLDAFDKAQRHSTTAVRDGKAGMESLAR